MIVQPSADLILSNANTWSMPPQEFIRNQFIRDTFHPFTNWKPSVSHYTLYIFNERRTSWTQLSVGQFPIHLFLYSWRDDIKHSRCKNRIAILNGDVTVEASSYGILPQVLLASSSRTKSQALNNETGDYIHCACAVERVNIFSSFKLRRWTNDTRQ